MGIVVILFTMDEAGEFNSYEDKLRDVLAEDPNGVINEIVFDTSICPMNYCRYLGDLCLSMKVNYELNNHPKDSYRKIDQIITLDSKRSTVEHFMENYKDEARIVTMKT